MQLWSQRRWIWEKPDHSDSTGGAPRQNLLSTLRSMLWFPAFHTGQALLLQVINDKGTQVVDTWAFNAEDLKVRLRLTGREC